MQSVNPSSPRDSTVTVVAWQALPAVFPDQGRRIGGLETAAWQFAQGLAQQSAGRVQFVVRCDRHRDSILIQGVRVIPITDRWLAMRRNVAQCIDVPGRRIQRFRLNLIWQVPLLALTWPWRDRDMTGLEPDPRLIQLHSDVWIAMGVNRESAAVISTALAQQKPSLLMIQSAADVSDDFSSQTSASNSRYGEPADACRHAIRNATTIVCQAAYQQPLLKARFGRDSRLVRNAIDLERWRAATELVSEQEPYVLWIGRFETFHKRIDRAIEIARRCPGIPFRLIANRSDNEVERQVRATLPDNVSLHEYVPQDQMPAMFAAARVFLSTGAVEYEGFPNVLLQAAATDTPIVSLEDFDGFIQSAGSGTVCSNDSAAAAVAINAYFAGQKATDRQSVQAYLQQHHSQVGVISNLIDAIQVATEQAINKQQPS